MNRKARPWIALGAAALAAVVLPIAALWPREQKPLQPYIWPKPTPLSASAVTPTIPVAQRMLFETAPTATMELAAPPTPPALLGIARRVRGKAVVIIRLAGGEEHVLAVGETVAGWTLISVGRNDARLSGPAGETVISFDFANQQTGTAGLSARNDGNGM